MRVGLLCSSLVIVALIFSCATALKADNIQFPPPPNDAISAASSFVDRAKIITHYNACGRELEYSTFRREQLDENYESQGEP